MTDSFEQAKALFQRGVALAGEGRWDAAHQQFAASLALLPGRASTLTNLGIALWHLRRPQEALDALDEALAQEPNDVDALMHRALSLAALGRPVQALEAVDRALAAQPRLGAGWGLKGSLLRELGRNAEAVPAFEQAVALGHEVELHRYYLAALRGAAVPEAPPRAYVQGLFDEYAAGFEDHVVAQLGYHAPEQLAARLAGVPLPLPAALDLGCGTGLCGPHLQRLAGAVDGVDLSPQMLERAQARGCYRALHAADVAEHLAATPQRYGLVVAADVFIYVGRLDAAFAGAARVLPPGGVFAFTVEEADAGQPLQLRPSLRYAHGRASIEALAAAHGFEVLELRAEPIRHEQRQPIPGLLAWLVRR